MLQQSEIKKKRNKERDRHTNKQMDRSTRDQRRVRGNENGDTHVIHYPKVLHVHWRERGSGRGELAVLLNRSDAKIFG